MYNAGRNGCAALCKCICVRVLRVRVLRVRVLRVRVLCVRVQM